MKITRFFALATILSTLAALHPLIAATKPEATAKAKTAASSTAPMDPKQKEARRVVLQRIITDCQAIMDRYEKQSSFKKSPTPVSEQEYLKAKTRRDAAQKERDALAF